MNPYPSPRIVPGNFLSQIFCSLFLVLSTQAAEEAIDPARAANTIILTEIGVQNLRIQTVEADEQDFESTIFAIGRVEEIPSMRSVLSSRISGRAIKVNAFEGDTVKKGQVLVEVESRQPGSPPPVISLTAAQDGTIIATHVVIGQPVEPDNELLDISDRSQMWAVAKIPEKQAAGIKIGTQAHIFIPALGGDPISSELIRFGIQADRQAGTVEGIFLIDNKTGALQPGMRTEFSIITSTREDVMSVPRESVQGDPSNRVVFVKDFDLPNAFIRAPVVLGEQNEQFVEIINGLLPGDEVVTEGSYALSFAGGGSLSLKEALDAAHGHEHNEDGSELAPEQQKAQDDAENSTANSSGGSLNTMLAVYAGAVTLILIGALQLLWKRKSVA
jgi:cobalt-zinc-cadmium efflux system membrane fusion protein